MVVTLKVAEVRNIEDDPTQSGRAQIRIYNDENDEKSIKDSELPWAILGLPVTSASTAKIGVSPSGLIIGSRVLITYLPDDTSEQYPIILCSLGRGDLPTKKGIRSETDGDSGGSIRIKGPDNPVIPKS